MVLPNVSVWYQATEGLGARETAAASRILSRNERARFDRFVLAHDRRDFAAAHALLRTVLSSHGNAPPESWRFVTDSEGKPSLAPGQPTFEFNLSHTRGLVTCAITTVGRAGVDAESVDRISDPSEIASSYFSTEEIVGLRQFEGAERREHFAELWTLKEAFLKAIGTGLADSLRDFRFRLTGARGIRFDAPPGICEPDWYFAVFAPLLGYRVAVAVHSVAPVAVRLEAWPPTASSAPVIPLRTSDRIGNGR